MPESSKVVALEVGSAKSNLAKLPPILHTVRQRTKRTLIGLLEVLFNNADDALFEMADRSLNDADQHMYFESMREVRLQRKNISAEFLSLYFKGFEKLFSAPETADEPDHLDLEDHAESRMEDMALLKNDELEIAVAVAGIISKVTSKNSLTIMQLTKRIDSVCRVQSVTEKLNPVGPHQVSHAFASALTSLDIDIKVRIILLKLFERFVMEQLGNMYNQANQLLAEAGVLPNLRREIKKSTAPEEQTATDRNEIFQQTSGKQKTGFGLLQNLLQTAGLTNSDSGYGNSGGSYGNSGGGYGNSGGTGTGNYNPAALITTDQLMSVLNSAQTEDRERPINLEVAPAQVDLRNLVLARVADVTGQSTNQIAQTDNDTVNLISMLFDYILNDRNLAIPMKALIARLQIPMLKIAVVDKSFFEKTSHPARQLLNELSSAGIGWSSAAELKRDKLYNKIESVVLRVLNGAGDELKLFAKLVSELRAFVSKDQKRYDLVEQRVRETETGKALSESAKKTVQQLINHKATGMRLPQNLGRFISDTWSRVLVYFCVTEGTESSEWQGAVKLLDDLLWSVQPLDTLADIEKRERGLSELTQDIVQCMLTIGMQEAQADEECNHLTKVLSEISQNDRNYLEDDQHIDDTQSPIRPDSEEEFEEIILTSTTPGMNLDPISVEPEFLEPINKLREGSWVEITEDDGSSLRCKLATIIDPGNRYVFVNRRGMKVAEKTRMGLAVLLKSKNLVLLEESQVFDRALQAVIGNLRQMHGESEPVD